VVLLFSLCLTIERHNEELNEVNSVLLDALQQTGFSKAKTPRSFMFWAMGPFLDFLYQERFQNVTKTAAGQMKLAGVTLADFDAVLAGVVLVQRRGVGPRECNSSLLWSRRLLPCFEDGTESKEWAPAGLNGTSYVYNAHFDGYYQALPTASSKAQVHTVLNTLEASNYIDKQTRALELRFATYNANLNVVSIATLSSTFSVAGSRGSPQLTVASIPNSISSCSLCVSAEVAFVAFWTVAAFFTVSDFLKQQRGRAASSPALFRSPLVNDAEEHLVALAIHAVLACTVIVWVALKITYSSLWAFASDEEQLSVSFNAIAELSDNDADASDKFSALYLFHVSLSHRGVRFAAVWSQVETCYSLFQTYYTLSALAAILLVFRLFEQIDFQKRLNAFTATLRAVYPDLMHFLVLLGLSVVFMGFAGHLIYGAYWVEFITILDSIVSTFWMSVGIWRPSPLALARLPYTEMATLFVFLLQCIVVLVILSMVVAIIFAEYGETRGKSRGKARPQSVPDDLRLLWRHRQVLTTDMCRVDADKLSAAGIADEEAKMNAEELTAVIGPTAGRWLHEWGEPHETQ